MTNRKSAAKAIDKEFRRLGARRYHHPHGTEYQFPDGARRLVNDGVKWSAAHDMMREARNRYNGYERRPVDGVRVPESQHPKINLDKLVSTDHARERLTEMVTQDDQLTMTEILHALTLPMRVLWSDTHTSYAWVGPRVTVVGNVSDDGVLTIRTLLWSTTDLWAQNPRKASA